MKQKLIQNCLVILIALSLVSSVLVTLYYGLSMQAAGSPDCNMYINSALICNATMYKDRFIVWCLVTIVIGITALIFTRQQLKKQKK